MGQIYLMYNDFIPGVTKIGRSRDLDRRVIELSSPTGVPGQYRVYTVYQVNDDFKMERLFHKQFHDKRIHPRKELFRVDKRVVRETITRLIYDRHLDHRDHVATGAYSHWISRRISFWDECDLLVSKDDSHAIFESKESAVKVIEDCCNQYNCSLVIRESRSGNMPCIAGDLFSECGVCFCPIDLVFWFIDGGLGVLRLKVIEAILLMLQNEERNLINQAYIEK